MCFWLALNLSACFYNLQEIKFAIKLWNMQKGFLFNSLNKSFHPRIVGQEKKAALQQSWQTCGSQLPPQVLSLVHLN